MNSYLATSYSALDNSSQHRRRRCSSLIPLVTFSFCRRFPKISIKRGYTSPGGIFTTFTNGVCLLPFSLFTHPSSGDTYPRTGYLLSSPMVLACSHSACSPMYELQFELIQSGRSSPIYQPPRLRKRAFAAWPWKNLTNKPYDDSHRSFSIKNNFFRWPRITLGCQKLVEGRTGSFTPSLVCLKWKSHRCCTAMLNFVRVRRTNRNRTYFYARALTACKARYL